MNPLFNKYSFALLLLASCVSGEAASTVVRSITGNNTASPGVIITATPDPSVSAYAVQESLPSGLTPANITQGGTWDAVNLMVKWGPWFDTTARTLSYTVTGGPGTYSVSGLGSFDGASVPTTGASQVVIPAPTAPSTVVRTITGGTNVSVVATPASTVGSYAVQESLPAGLTPANITQGGTWDAVNQMVKWGPWFDTTARTLSYTVTGSPGTYTVSGVGSFDGASVPTTGTSQVVIPPPATLSTAVRTILGGTNVTLLVTPGSTMSSYAVQENLPTGLTPANITQGGTWDPINQMVKWGPWFDTSTRTLSYTVTGNPGTYKLGNVVGIPTTGDFQITIAQPAVPSGLVRTILSGTNVSVVATPASTVSSYAVQENLPNGLTPANITQGGTWDAVNQMVKWGPWFDTTARTLSYAVAGSPGTYTVSGVGSFDGASVPTTGASQIVIPPPPTGSTVVRTITGGTNVSVVATPASTVSSYAVQESLPAGLTPANITQGGTWDAVNQMVKWGPWFDTTPRTLSYTVTGSPGTYTVSGVGSFDGASVPTTGTSQIVVSQTGPIILMEPASTNVLAGSDVMFSVIASGLGPLTYLWQLNGTNLPSGIITTVAGDGTNGFSGDGGAGTNAQLNGPDGVAVDLAGNLFIADSGNQVIRKVATNGIISTLAANGTLRQPRGLAAMPFGNKAANRFITN